MESQPLVGLLVQAGRNAVWTVAAGFVMNELLPCEQLSGVLTDMSLLELGVSHPLLQERSPLTPTTTPSPWIDRRGGSRRDRRGLGAVGAISATSAGLKPTYYIENQPPGRPPRVTRPANEKSDRRPHQGQRDLARQHLPEPIIDFLEQHHGTTLVEYFYRRASEQEQNNPDGGGGRVFVPYPGRSPRRREAAVLMLADAAESCRSLVEAGPACESLVREIMNGWRTPV